MPGIPSKKEYTIDHTTGINTRDKYKISPGNINKAIAFLSLNNLSKFSTPIYNVVHLRGQRMPAKQPADFQPGCFAGMIYNAIKISSFIALNCRSLKIPELNHVSF